MKESALDAEIGDEARIEMAQADENVLVGVSVVFMAFFYPFSVTTSRQGRRFKPKR